MSFASIREKMKQFDQNAAVIFDQQEPIGSLTDMVMPRRRWLRRRQPELPLNHGLTKASAKKFS